MKLSISSTYLSKLLAPSRQHICDLAYRVLKLAALSWVYGQFILRVSFILPLVYLLISAFLE